MSVDKFLAKTKDVGGIPVARLLPQNKHRTVGAWCFLDHAGPATFSQENKGMQVGLHPHTNLQTFTWMLEGEVWHQDSLGNRQLIRPKQVNLMTAGTGNQRGISHTEQTPAGVKNLHAVQLWIALPMNQEIEPNFEHYPQLPEWSDQGIDYILTTGSYQGRQAPTSQFSPLVGVDMRFQQAQAFEIERQDKFEYAILVINGTIKINGESYAKDEIAILSDCTSAQEELKMWAEQGTHIMLLGGEPLPHPTVIWWNFVADKVEDLEQAVNDWNNQHPRFGTIDLQGTELSRLTAPAIPARLKR
ncbi:quercetin 2,3-dioxygenase [Gallibacterium anatis]|uniref:pirin family protein n=1 Tax=Gallibacterium anatis TaxID=750 RepID=UPI0005315A4C|nr:pirin family protein [Gallibacterium anatis]KGQ45642.1 quercetin 2,3-dioxygenase [Gallibacterium anatis]KGQ49471.1 quercetin 2,3-dioxygenase [Gallibacterium anatis]KGQ58864.1 quercetin 2,3-dioxygenase [Gallibacterium anatis]